MIIHAIADLHGYTMDLDGGDILIVAGDCTAGDTTTEWKVFFEWLVNTPYRHKVLVGGNHDVKLADGLRPPGPIHYLENDEVTLDGYRIWGSPNTHRFLGQNPSALAFTCYREDMREHWRKMPDDVDIVVTHGPALDILDATPIGIRVGDYWLGHELMRARPRIAHIHGHTHHCHGMSTVIDGILRINACVVNDAYSLRAKEPIDVLEKFRIAQDELSEFGCVNMRFAIKTSPRGCK